MRPGAPVSVTQHVGLFDSAGSERQSTSQGLPIGSAGGADASEGPWNGAVQTIALVEDCPIALRDLETFLELLTRVVGPKLIRLTGLVALADDPGRPLVLHTGELAVYPWQRLATWPSQDRRTRMIAITQDLDPAILKRLFASVARPWPDRMRIRVAMAASATLLAIFALGLAFVLHSNARTTVEVSSVAPWTQDRGF